MLRMPHKMKFNNYVSVEELETRLVDHILQAAIDLSVKTGNTLELYNTLKKNDKVASPTMVMNVWEKLLECDGKNSENTKYIKNGVKKI